MKPTRPLSNPHASPVGRAIARAETARRLAELHRHIVSFNVSIYLADDGAPAAELLANLAWILAIGTQVSLQNATDQSDTRRIHAALRTVVQMSVDGGRWQAGQARVLHEAAELAKVVVLAHNDQALAAIENAAWLAGRIQRGQARLTDVAGSEIYNAMPVAP